MGYICDFCGDQRSTVFCRSDSACLCLSCDRNVHSANALSRRHSRTLLCERCNSEPACVRCVEERISLCLNCDWLSHVSSVSTAPHKRQPINSYSGCPYASELSSIWSFALDSRPSGDAAAVAGNSSCERNLSLMNISDNSTNALAAHVNNVNRNMTGLANVSNTISLDKSRPWAGLSSIPESCSRTRVLNLPAGTINAPFPKSYCTNAKAPELCEDDLYKDFNMDEVDLTLENYDELFGMTLSNSEDFFENGGIDSLFQTEDMSAADSNGQAAAAAEGSSVGLVNEMQPACSTAASADSLMSAKTEPIICFSARQGHSSVSFPGIAGEGSADYQDCGASLMFLSAEPPCCPPCSESSLQSANRTNAVMRYKEKKKTRKFEKKVRYASRKARADVRRRVKGRFIKAGDAYDYDPLNQTRSC